MLQTLDLGTYAFLELLVNLFNKNVSQTHCVLALVTNKALCEGILTTGAVDARQMVCNP